MQGLGLRTVHGEGVGVLEAQRAQNDDAVARLQRLRQLRQHRPAAGVVGALQHVRPERAGVVDIGVDLAGLERVVSDAGAQILLARHRGAFRLQPTGDQVGQDVLLGEVLGADRVARLAAGDPPTLDPGERGEGDQRPHHQSHGAGDDPPTLAPRQSALDQAEQLVRRHGQRRRGAAAKEDEHPVLGLQAGENVVAQRGLADRGGQGRRADGPNRGGAHAGHDHRRGQRQLHREQALAVGHADALGRLHHRRIDTRKPGHAVPQDRQHGIEAERQQRGQEAKGRETVAEPGFAQRRKRQQQRVEEGEQREARDRLHQARQRQGRPAQRRAATRRHRQRQTDGEAEDERAGADQHVLTQIVGQQRPGGGDARVHQTPPASSARTRSAWRRGVSINARTRSSGWPARSAAGEASASTLPEPSTTIRSASSSASQTS